MRNLDGLGFLVVNTLNGGSAPVDNLGRHVFTEKADIRAWGFRDAINLTYGKVFYLDVILGRFARWFEFMSDFVGELNKHSHMVFHFDQTAFELALTPACRCILPLDLFVFFAQVGNSALQCNNFRRCITWRLFATTPLSFISVDYLLNLLEVTAVIL